MEKVRDILRNISTQIIVGMVISVLATAVAGVWAWLSRLDGLYIFLIVIGTLFLSVVLVNQLDGFLQRRRKPLFEQSSRYIDSTLREWLYKGNFSVRQRRHEKYEFAFVARDKQERPIIVGKPNDSEEVLLQAIVRLTPNEIEKVEKLEEDIKRKLVSELRISLARQQVQYYGLEMPVSEIGIVNIMVLNESFTRDVFMDRIDRVRNATVLVLELLNPVIDRKTGMEELPIMKMDAQNEGMGNGENSVNAIL